MISLRFFFTSTVFSIALEKQLKSKGIESSKLLGKQVKGKLIQLIRLTQAVTALYNLKL